MKSKIRTITVDGNQFVWSVKELDWDKVLLTVWVKGLKSLPWFTIEREFHNPWYLIGQVNEVNIASFNMKPITPKEVSHVIRQVISGFGRPSEISKSLKLSVDKTGKFNSG